jgi:hypothetical protein
MTAMHHRPTPPHPGARALFGLALLLTASPEALAQTAEQTRAKKKLDQEPPAAEVVQLALEHFRVHPEMLDTLRARSHSRALMPLLASGYRFDDARGARASQQMISDPNNVAELSNDRSNSFSVGAVWDLRELVFNPAEVQVFGLIGVQRDVMLEVTRTYYLRKQLLLQKIYEPPSDPLSLGTLELRVEELTAILDVLTGGGFSRRMAGAPAAPRD